MWLGIIQCKSSARHRVSICPSGQRFWKLKPGTGLPAVLSQAKRSSMLDTRCGTMLVERPTVISEVKLRATGGWEED
jgi:hypothetical protein